MKQCPVKLAICFLLTALLSGSRAAGAADEPTIIKISAKKYEYTPSEIVLKKGQPVTLQLTSEDRHHGFEIPAWKIRTDIQPGTVSAVKLQPTETGEFEFHCDVFCGGGHEGMSGTIKVTD